MKKNKKQFSEEELAAYIDGALPQSRAMDLESSLTDDMLELIGVTRAAIEQIPQDNVVLFPEWGDIASRANPFSRHRNPLAMAGFLGNEEEDTETPSNDPESGPEEKEE